MIPSILFRVDSYKLSHPWQYPKGMTEISDYIESRRGGDVLFFGLQAYLRTLDKVRMPDVEYARDLYKAHGVPFNYEGFKFIAEELDGNLPLEIQAVPEGYVYPERTPLVQIKNTHPAFAWLPSHMETSMLRSVWYPSSVATISYRAKRVIYQNLVETADDPDGEIGFKLHDFGARGVSSGESAALGGLAHLVSFKGTDTVEALLAARQYYDEPMAGFSIPAAEHSTITSWLKTGEADAYRNMLAAYPDSSMVAVVSDSYDIFNACDNIWGGLLKDRVERFGAHGKTLVIRPDSGDPKETVLRVLEILMDRFGYKTNSKGYKVLPKYLRIIQGDGVNLQSITEILAAMKARGYSGSNIAFGMGGGLLQKVDRDTFAFAMKACSGIVDGVQRDIYKDPVGDKGKASKRGRQVVMRDWDDEQGYYHFTSMPESLFHKEFGNTLKSNWLEYVWRDGKTLRNASLTTIRGRQ